MGNIAGALESPRFTTLPRPSHSDAIYLPNCSSDAFITLLDLSPYNKKKKHQIPPLAAFPVGQTEGKVRGVSAARSTEPRGLHGAGRECWKAPSVGLRPGRDVGMELALGRHPLPNWAPAAKREDLSPKALLALSREPK